MCVLTLALAGAVALAMAAVASGSDAPARATASAYAVLINVPGAQSSGTLTSPAGSYQYRDLVAIHSYTAGSALSGERGYGHSELAGVTLLGGAVTAGAIASRTYADGRSAPATGSFGGSVSDLVVAGATVSVQPGGQFTIPGIGWGAVDERRIVRSDGAYRGSEVGLHIHLSSDWHDLPAGTEILLGYSDAAATAPPGGSASTAGAPAGAATAGAATHGGESETNPGLLGAPVVPVPASDGTPTDSGDGVTPTGIEAPPPGGFTLTPPVSPAVQQQLTSPGYVFPVAGGAHYGHDFGNFRADTGFHEGSDLFAPEGTPLVAVQSGRAPQRGLESPRRLAALGRGHPRQLVLLRAPVGVLADRQERCPRQRGRCHRIRGQHGRRPGRTDAPALRDPSSRPVGLAAVRLPAGLAGSPQPVCGDPGGARPATAGRRLPSSGPRTSRPPPVWTPRPC